MRDPHSDPNVVNANLLDTGDYPTTPSDPLGTAGSREAGALVEARRMAEAVLVPFEVDKRFDKSGNDVTPFTDQGRLNTILYSNQSIGNAAGRHNLVAGFLTSAQSSENALMKISHIVMRFGSPQDATDAVNDMAEHSEADSQFNKRHPRPIADRPDIQVFWDEDDKETGKFRGLHTYTAHGPYVIADLVGSETVDEAIELAVAAIDKQRAALDGFEATPVDKLADLPLDPDGLLAHTLPYPKGATKSDANGVYGQHGALHFMMNPLRDQQLFDDAGVTEMARGFATVYQTRNATAAAKVAADFAVQIGELTYPKYVADEPINGLPAARCLKPDGETSRPMFRCVAYVDRYVMEAAGSDTESARRALAAQYVMLSAK
ncbi:hypothetical protein A5643_00910 [Mycobacterium sp. 1274756.6]|nr:hypothetical protein A5643_00910 [Mycobacterium sp. 1274756.6]